MMMVVVGDGVWSMFPFLFGQSWYGWQATVGEQWLPHL